MNSKFVRTGLGALLIFLALAIAAPVMADSTSVLPKGRSAVTLGYVADTIGREFDDRGSDRELGYFLNNQDITAIGEPVVNQLVINAYLIGIGAGFTVPANYDSMQLAMTTLDSRVKFEAIPFSYQYGITDKLTVGLGFAYITEAHTDIEFGVVAIPSAQAISDGFGPLFAALDPAELAQGYLHGVLKYDRVEDWSGSPNIGDIKLGAKYRYLDGDKVKAASGGWVTLPTGRVDDERNLTDVRYGNGSYDIGLYSMVDFVPVDPVTVNLTGRYVYTFPFHRGIYILDKNNPQFYDAEFATKHVFGDYDTGNYYELETETSLELARGIDAFAGFFYRQTESTKIDDDLVPKSIEIERKLFMGVSASTVEAFLADEAKVPVIYQLYAEPVQTGKNITKTGRVVFTTTLLF